VEPLRGRETVLVVEDEASVRMVARQVLERYGYAVLEAPNGDTALRLAASTTGRFTCLLTDVVMPGLSGRQLAEQLVQLRPDMKVLYASAMRSMPSSSTASSSPASRTCRSLSLRRHWGEACRQVLDSPPAA